MGEVNVPAVPPTNPVIVGSGDRITPIGFLASLFDICLALL